MPTDLSHQPDARQPDPARTDLAQQIENELPHLRRYAGALTRDRADMEDLVQDCVERALSRGAQFRPGTDLRRWLFTILRNIHIDGRRKIARRGHHMPFEDWHAETRSPPAQYYYLRLGEVEERLRRLRSCDRRIVLLSVLGGMNHEGIARRMNVAVGTVKSRLSRARQALAA